MAISRAPKHLIRPQLVFLGGIGGGGTPDDPRLERFAVGVELLHLFLLVHDDVMDNASRRRGHPTLHVALRAKDSGIAWPVARDLAIVMGNMLNVPVKSKMLDDMAKGMGVAGITISKLGGLGGEEGADAASFGGPGFNNYVNNIGRQTDPVTGTGQELREMIQLFNSTEDPEMKSFLRDEINSIRGKRQSSFSDTLREKALSGEGVAYE